MVFPIIGGAIAGGLASAIGRRLVLSGASRLPGAIGARAATATGGRYSVPIIGGFLGAGVGGNLMQPPGSTPESVADAMNSPGLVPAGNEAWNQYGDMGGLFANLPSMGASTMSPATVNFSGAPPSNPSGALAAAARRAYQPQIKYAKSVIPYYESREKASKGEIQDLRNIAERSWVKTAGRIREGTEASAEASAQRTQETIGALEGGAVERAEGMDNYLKKVGIDKTVEGANQATDNEAAAGQGLAAAEGSIFSNLISEQGMNAANYADTVAGIQDTAAAADIALLRQNMSELIFRQQGRIAEAQQAQAVAMMQAALQGQQMYQDAYNQYTSMMYDAASLNAKLAQEAAQYNASAQNAANQYNADMAFKALSASAAGAEGSSGGDYGTGLAGSINATKDYLMNVPGNGVTGFSNSQIDDMINAFNSARLSAVQNSSVGMDENGRPVFYEPSEQELLMSMYQTLSQSGVPFDPDALQVYVNNLYGGFSKSYGG